VAAAAVAAPLMSPCRFLWWRRNQNAAERPTDVFRCTAVAVAVADAPLTTADAMVLRGGSE